MNSLFKEKQKIRNPFIRILLLAGIFLPLVLIRNKIDINLTVEENIFENFGFISLTFLIYLVIAFIFSYQLKVFLNQYGIFVKFFPFLERHIDWFSVKQAKIINCNFKSFMGISFNPEIDSAYNINAKKGLHLILNNNKELIIGIKNTRKLEKVINTYRGIHKFE